MKWEDLSLIEKSQLIKLCVQNGIKSLPKIKEYYNSLAGGGAVPFSSVAPSSTSITSYPDDAVTSSGEKYKDIIERRYRGVYNALRSKGYTIDESTKLAEYLTSQSLTETGYVSSNSRNNLAGYKYNDTLMSFPSEEEFWQYHIDNLTKKWGPDNPGGAWDKAESVEDYVDRVNNTKLKLSTKSQYDAYNKASENPVYLYAPDWENTNYKGKINSVNRRVRYYTRDLTPEALEPTPPLAEANIYSGDKTKTQHLSTKERNWLRSLAKLAAPYIYKAFTPDISNDTEDPKELKYKVKQLLTPAAKAMVSPAWALAHQRPQADSLSEEYWKRYLFDQDTSRVERLPQYLKKDIDTFISNNLSNPDSPEAHSYWMDEWDIVNGVTKLGKGKESFYQGAPRTFNEYDIYPEFRENGELTPASALGRFAIQLIDNGKKAVVYDTYDFGANEPAEQDTTFMRKARRLADKVYNPFPIRDTIELTTPVTPIREYPRSIAPSSIFKDFRPE